MGMSSATPGIAGANAATARERNVPDADLVAAAMSGSAAAFEAIMRRHNRRLFRTARAILRNDADAEEVVQEAYIKVFLHLGDFAQQSRLSTWLVKITVNEALGRRRRGNTTPLGEAKMNGESNVILAGFCTAAKDSPEAAAAQSEVRHLVEAAIDALPQAQRAVFVLRAVEEFSTEETALCLDIPAETVKTRLHRARRQLRRSLKHRLAAALQDTFPFAGERCDRIVSSVLERLALRPPAG